VTDSFLQDGAAFIGLMRRYVADYTNRHDQSVTAELMESNYTLRMGQHVVEGREGAYRAATAKQMHQFPGLGLTVHRIATSGERLVMHFSEHGASRRHDGRVCAWGGIGLYAWNGSKLVSNLVEQDYLSRREQLATGIANAIVAPAIAPWNQVAEARDVSAEQATREWLESGQLATTPNVLCDDQIPGQAAAKLIDQETIVINDLFSCGQTVAFHVTQHGRLAKDSDMAEAAGQAAFVDMSGIVEVSDMSVRSGHIIRNRLDLHRRMLPRPAA
jgi:hypothetical protein